MVFQILTNFVQYDIPYLSYHYYLWVVYMINTYGTGKKKRLSYLVGNLVATNWPIEKALHAIGYNQIPTKFSPIS